MLRLSHKASLMHQRPDGSRRGWAMYTYFSINTILGSTEYPLKVSQLLRPQSAAGQKRRSFKLFHRNSTKLRFQINKFSMQNGLSAYNSNLHKQLLSYRSNYVTRCIQILIDTQLRYKQACRLKHGKNTITTPLNSLSITEKISELFR